ncbi:Protein phosphatase 1 regulatory subunit 26 [Plecturocebus cupreus]
MQEALGVPFTRAVGAGASRPPARKRRGTLRKLRGTLGSPGRPRPALELLHPPPPESAAYLLRSEGRDAARSRGAGSERNKGSKGPAQGLPSRPLADFSPLLSTQGPSFSAFREAQVGPSPVCPVFGSPHLLAKDSEPWPSRKAQTGLNLPDWRNSGSEESILDLRYRQRVIDRDDQDVLAVTPPRAEDSGGSLVVKV